MALRFDTTTHMALDSVGAPISGAKLNFYQTGTSTPLDTYSDDALSSANANPVVADSAGRFGDIFLKPQDYKVVLTDAADVTLNSDDPVHGGVEVTELPTASKTGLDTKFVTGTAGSNKELGTWNGDGDLVSGVLQGTATYNPASLADGAGATTTVTVTGAVLGDYVIASFSLDLQGITLTAYVSAADTVAVRFQNETTGTLDLASGTLAAMVIPK